MSFESLHLTSPVHALVLALGLCACGSPAPNPEPARSAAAGDGLAVVDEDPIDYEACAEISAAASSLIDATMTCDARNQCEAIPAVEVMPSSCIPAVSCYLAASTTTDLEPVLEELRQLEIEYQQECGLCPTVQCIPERRVAATCDDSGSCDLEATPPYQRRLESS